MSSTAAATKHRVSISSEATPLLLSSSSRRRQRSTEALGLVLMTLAAFGFSSMSLFVKLSTGFPSFEIVLARSVLQAVFGLVGCAWLGIHPLGSQAAGVRKWLVVRSLAGTTGLALYFYSITQLPLADAVVVFFLGPTFTAVLAAVVLNEPFSCFDGVCAGLCMLGAALVSKPTFLFGGGGGGGQETDDGLSSLQRALATACALLGAVMSAVAYVTVRKIGKGAHFLVHTVYFGCIASFVSAPAMLAFQTFVMPTGWYNATMLLMTGVTAFIGQCFLNKGLQLAPAGPGSLMRMNEVVFAFIFGISILHEYPDWYSISGTLLIVTMTSALGFHRWHKSRRSS